MSIPVIAVAQGKGGSGKSTATMSIAASLADGTGVRVLAVDCDPQQSVKFWSERAGDRLPFDFAADATDPAMLRRLQNADQWDLILVDCPGNLREHAILSAILDQSSYCIVPMPTAALAVGPTEQTIEQFIKPRGIPFRVLLSMVDARHSTDQQDMRALLDAKDYPTFSTGIRRYVAHERAPLAGLVVTQYADTELANRNAVDDFRRVALELMGDLARTRKAGAA